MKNSRQHHVLFRVILVIFTRICKELATIIHQCFLFVCLIVFSVTFHNIPVISWRSVLLAEETGENRRPVASH